MINLTLFVIFEKAAFEIVVCCKLEVALYGSKQKCVFFCLKIIFTFTNSVDPDEMHNAAFHLGLHCLQNYSFKGFPVYKG